MNKANVLLGLATGIFVFVILFILFQVMFNLDALCHPTPTAAPFPTLEPWLLK